MGGGWSSSKWKAFFIQRYIDKGNKERQTNASLKLSKWIPSANGVLRLIRSNREHICIHILEDQFKQIIKTSQEIKYKNTTYL